MTSDLRAKARSAAKLRTRRPAYCRGASAAGRGQRYATPIYYAPRTRLRFSDKLSEINWILRARHRDLAASASRCSIRWRRATSILGPADKWCASPSAWSFCSSSRWSTSAWISLAYPAYGGVTAFGRRCRLGHVGLGAQRWIDIGPLQLAAVGADEDCPGAGARALSARLDLEDVSKPLHLFRRCADDRLPAGLVLLQPNLGTATILIVGDA